MQMDWRLAVNLLLSRVCVKMWVFATSAYNEAQIIFFRIINANYNNAVLWQFCVVHWLGTWSSKGYTAWSTCLQCEEVWELGAIFKAFICILYAFAAYSITSYHFAIHLRFVCTLQCTYSAARTHSFRSFYLVGVEVFVISFFQLYHINLK